MELARETPLSHLARSAGAPRRCVIALTVAVVGLLLAPALASAAEADLLGVTDHGVLVRFNADAPGLARTLGPVTGVVPGESLVALQWRYDPVYDPSNVTVERLFAASDEGRVYAVDPGSRVAQATGAPLPLPTSFSLADYQAIAGHTDQVLQEPGVPPPGPFPTSESPAPAWYLAFTNDLAYAPGDPGEGSTPDIVAAAHVYVHEPPPFVGVWRPLMAIDAARDVLVESGTQQAKSDGFYTVGSLGIPVQAPASLVIAPDGTALLAAPAPLAPTPTSALYRVDLTTGSTTPLGLLPAGTLLRSMVFVPPALVAVRPMDAWLPAPTVDLPVQRYGDPVPAVSFHYDATTCGDPQCWDYPPGPVAHDWLPSTGTETLAPGQETATLDLPTAQGNVDFDSVKVVLSDPSGGGLLTSETQAYVTNGGPRFADPELAARSGQGSMPVTVTRGPDQPAAAVSYAVGGGDAAAGRDYSPVSGLLTFAANQQTQAFDVPIGPGTPDGATRSVQLTVSAPDPHVAIPGAVNRDVATLVIHHPAIPSGGAAALHASLRALRVRRGRVTVYFSCSSPCRAALTLRRVAKGSRGHLGGLLASRRVSERKAGRAHVVLILSPGARRASSRALRNGSTALLSLSVSDAVGQRVTLERSVRLRSLV